MLAAPSSSPIESSINVSGNTRSGSHHDLMEYDNGGKKQEAMALSTIGSTATNTIDYNLRTITINFRGECNLRILKLGEVMSPAGVGHGDEKSMVESRGFKNKHSNKMGNRRTYQ